MRTVIDSVRKLLLESPIELEALSRGELNLRSYARSIESSVSNDTMKPVSVGTITVALSRLTKEARSYPALLPEIFIDDLKVISPLCDIAYEKTVDTTRSFQVLTQKMAVSERKVLVMTMGVGEITIIASQELKDLTLSQFPVAPKAIVLDLVGITVSFSPEYLKTPNALYTLTSSLASKRINIIEMVSTYSELMVVVSKENMQQAIVTLQKFFPTA